LFVNYYYYDVWRHVAIIYAVTGHKSSRSSQCNTWQRRTAHVTYDVIHRLAGDGACDLNGHLFGVSRNNTTSINHHIAEWPTDERDDRRTTRCDSVVRRAAPDISLLCNCNFNRNHGSRQRRNRSKCTVEMLLAGDDELVCSTRVHYSTVLALLCIVL